MRFSGLRALDWALVAAVLALGLLGLAAGYSATRAISPALALRQALFLGIGALLMLALAMLDYRQAAQAGKSLYAAALLLLVCVLLAGSSGGGAARWLGSGAFRFQPSEFAKLALVIALAAFFSRRIERRRTLPVFAASALLAGIPALLVLLQPDLGTAIVFIALWLGAAALAGARKVHIGLAVLLGIALSIGMWHTGAIRPYQKTRLATFLNPGADPLGSGYHILQSKIAIGSGRILGRGFLSGPQSGLRFVPAQHTDFIFAVIGEEFGLVGALALLGCFAVVVWRMARISRRAADPLGALLAAVGAWLVLFQSFMNIGMTVTLLPVTGIPLPLVSYGGSSLLATMMLMGVVLSVGTRAAAGR